MARSTQVQQIFSKSNYSIQIQYFSSFYFNDSTNYSKISVTLDEDCIIDVKLDHSIEHYLASDEAFYGFTASYDNFSSPKINFYDPQLFVSKKLLIPNLKKDLFNKKEK